MSHYINIEKMSLCVGGEIVSTFGDPEKVKLGKCKLIEEVMIGEDKVRQTVSDLLNFFPCS